MSCDPALGEYIYSHEGEGGIYNSVNLNLYHYSGNNPIKYTDPTGLYYVDEATENVYDVKRTKELDKVYKWVDKPTKTKDELYKELGNYGKPGENEVSFRASDSPPEYDKKENFKFNLTGAIGNLEENNGPIFNFAPNGGAYEGSLNLITYRLKGTDIITNHELMQYLPTENYRTGMTAEKPLFAWQRIDNKKIAENILKSNPDLMQKGLANSKPSGFKLFFENLLKTMSGSNSR